ATIAISTVWIMGSAGNFKIIVMLMLLCTALTMERLWQYIFYSTLSVGLFLYCYWLAPQVNILVEASHIPIYSLVNNLIITALIFIFVFFTKNELLNNRRFMRDRQKKLKTSKLKIQEQNQILKEAYAILSEKESELLLSNEQLTKEIKRSNRLKNEQSYALSLLETTLESTPYGIWVTNQTGETERFNQQFIKLWGINSANAASDDQLLHTSILAQIAEPQIFKNRMEEISRYPNKKSRDLIYLHDGRVIERYSRPHIHRKEIIGRVWTFLDVTIQKKLENKLVVANQELDQFASAASHDMKEPLRTISSFSTLLSRRIPDQPAAKEYLHFIQDAASRMTQLLDDLINFARAGRSQEDLIPIDLNRILLLVQNNLHSSILQNEVRLETVSLPTVMGQSTIFIQLFQNLIANGIKFQNPDNQVIIKIGLQEIGDFWQIGIQDNGIGMATEYLERIFKPFTRLHSHTDYQGSGIGLATCTKIVQQYGGRIWVESTLGVGTTFYFTLPKMEEQPSIEMPVEAALKN
ncbi:MAG: ATP-binding protein, partial [Saprospiraceae bacterium]